MIDPLASSVKPITKDRFSHAMAHFFIARATSDTSKHDLDILSGFYLVLHCTLYEISMR